MQDFRPIENDFLNKITAIIEENIANEQFGVSELAGEIGMSRSNLLRKVQKSAKISASKFISQVRLRQAMEILSQTSLTVSEVSFKVGFNSTSYFIKCFREYYGYPPGEVGKKDSDESDRNPMDQPPQSHQLAAIMFTDIQGFTALMQQDEVKAIEFRSRHREVFNTVTEKHKGKILQYYGDGTLSTFSSAINAVRCGIELQLAFCEEPPIPVRIGIHSGDILFTDDGIIGDGVNVASRIESLAVAGSVFISEKVYDEVKNQSGIRTASMGIFELKNVSKPVEVFAITNPGLIVPEGDQIAGKVKSESLSGKREMRLKEKLVGVLWILLPLIAILLGYFIYSSDILKNTTRPNVSSDAIIAKKSIAVLPFINDSNDSTNVYIINGLMESTLNNLQKIKDLRVISRTSVEKYRNNLKSIPEIGRELNVHYLIEGSGQKIGDQIMLNIQLIEAPSDKHLWGEQYNREAKDIFKLQMEVAKTIADKIQVIVTPDEEERINKVPTNNLEAYDYFLKGLDLFYKGNPENLMEAITYYQKAIAHDNEFARAYAGIAIAYYFLDFYQTEKKYSDLINQYADKALLYDAQLPQSLIAKAVYYMGNGEYELAASHLEKALEYNPNSALVINILSDFYAKVMPNTEKYLGYALKGIGLDIASNDSVTASYIYLHVSNAFIQSGFIDEAEMYIDKSLEYNPENLYSEYVKAYILYAGNRDLQQIKGLLIQALDKDTTRLDIMQEVGKIFYYLRDYESAYRYYKKFIEISAALNLNIYNSENAKIGFVLSKMGLDEESESYFRKYKAYAENDQSIYKHFSLAMYYSYKGEKEKAFEHLKLFSGQDNYHYWTLIFTPIDPLIDNVKDHHEFKESFKIIETKFWNYHKQVKASLEAKDLLY